MTLQHNNSNKVKVLFFTNSLKSGGKERRLIELMGFLKSSGRYDILLVLNSPEIHYNSFNELGIEYKILDKKVNHKDPKIFISFYKIVKSFKPDLIHTWGDMQTFYALPSKIIKRIPLINSQIASAPPYLNKFSFEHLVNTINFTFSDVILSNSNAGLKAYGVEGRKCKVIYNGINFDRFTNLGSKEDIRKSFAINTKYVVAMIANITHRKDYIRFSKVALNVLEKRNDVTFMIVGRIKDEGLHNRILTLLNGEEKVIITGRISNIEELVNAIDVGILLSDTQEHGEGIPNAVVEYMALAKPTIVNDAGGTKELVKKNETGYIVTNETEEEISVMLSTLLDNDELRIELGSKGQERIQGEFTIKKMGESFASLYFEVLKEV